VVEVKEGDTTGADHHLVVATEHLHFGRPCRPFRRTAPRRQESTRADGRKPAAAEAEVGQQSIHFIVGTSNILDAIRLLETS